MAIRPHSPEVQAHIELVNGYASDALELVWQVKDLRSARMRLQLLDEMMRDEQRRRVGETGTTEGDQADPA